jgi:hypothetical protein
MVVDHHVDGRSLRLQTATTTRLAFGVVLAPCAGYSTTVIANLYVRTYIRHAQRQFLYFKLAVAAFTLEFAHFSFEYFIYRVKYIPPSPIMSKMGYGESITSTFYHIYY